MSLSVGPGFVPEREPHGARSSSATSASATLMPVDARGCRRRSWRRSPSATTAFRSRLVPATWTTASAPLERPSAPMPLGVDLGPRLQEARSRPRRRSSSPSPTRSGGRRCGRGRGRRRAGRRSRGGRAVDACATRAAAVAAAAVDDDHRRAVARSAGTSRRACTPSLASKVTSRYAALGALADVAAPLVRLEDRRCTSARARTARRRSTAGTATSRLFQRALATMPPRQRDRDARAASGRAAAAATPSASSHGEAVLGQRDARAARRRRPSGRRAAARAPRAARSGVESGSCRHGPNVRTSREHAASLEKDPPQLRSTLNSTVYRRLTPPAP